MLKKPITVPNRLALANDRRAAIQNKLGTGSLTQTQATNRLQNINQGVRPIANQFGKQLGMRKDAIGNKLGAGAITQEQANNRLGRIQTVAESAYPTATNRLSKLSTQYQGMGAEDPARQAIADKIARISGRRGLNNPLDSLSPTTPTPTSTPAPQAPTTPVVEDAKPDLSTLFPNIRAFEPQNYEGSPLYQFQRDQGLKAMERLYSARGLTNSGAEIEGNARFMNELGGQEAERASRIAQLEADRLERIQNNESLRQERSGNDQWGRVRDILDFSMRNSPMEYAYGGSNSLGGLISGRGKTVYDHTSGMAPTVTVPGFAGGSFVPPFPTSPNFGAIDAAEAGYDGEASGGLWDTILGGAGKIIGGLF